MSDELLSEGLRAIRPQVEAVVAGVIRPRAEEVDREGAWPEHSMHALAGAGLLGLQVPKRYGGHGQGLLALATVTESIGAACASSALCFGMHCVATAVIAARATPHHAERYLRPIAEGRHVTTLALSESGSGAHFYLPATTLSRDPDGRWVVEGGKQFVTNGGHADSYVVSLIGEARTAESGEFSCLVMDRDLRGMNWLDPWRGMGMHGNSSRAVRFEGVRVPAENLLGAEGDQNWYVFEVVAPYFLMAMAGTYLGLAQAAVDATIQHLRDRRYAHSGETLGEAPVLQHRLAEIWADVQKTRGLIYNAARLGDLGDPGFLPHIFACKAEAADTAVRVTNEALTLCGGSAYRENSQLARLLRDARASHVMSPTTDLLKQWTGRALLGLPLL
ncbi:MAG: acyl-CoA dehydrogenase family protein [Deltaproteobacteria bacterium]|nr:acyl-CoA dehydrogenase family protein [Myxococcales bacterium]MDP3214162.1 acyl-CoA dehydrogenase family protein [Deltaproteobacteria bacterium]